MAEIAAKFDGDRIIIVLDPGQPVELNDLSGSFAALARMYERHYRNDGDEAPKLYVTKLETGSVIMEILPLVPLLGQAVMAMDSSIIVADFTNRLFRGIKAFSTPGEVPKVEPPSKKDASDIKEFTKPLLGKKGASLGIKHAKFEKIEGETATVIEYKFDENDLNRAAINIDQALALPAPKQDDQQPRGAIRKEVMLFLDQANRGPGKEKGRTGDKGVIPDISEKVVPVYFRNSIQNLKEQMTKEVNPLTSTFVVDVHVQYLEGDENPKGYIVTDVHQAIPDDDAE
ncbi:hypothetical protein IWQ49_003028 [Labrenzia sp. EL_126]|nr:hypothetical protein [Labrenzia sp. EL_126]